MLQNAPVPLKLVDVAARLNLPVRTLYHWIATERFNVPPIEGTKPRRWNSADIDTWIAGNRSAS